MELDVEVIRDLGHAYLPYVYDEISSSVSLKGHHVQHVTMRCNSPNVKLF